MIQRVDSTEPASVNPPEIEFFEGLAWPVPRAFAAPLASSRFEQGDVLYDAEEAYRPQGPAPLKGCSALQIVEPPRSTRVLPGENDGGRRQANWDSPVVLEWIDLAQGKARRQESTQGRLLMMLWQGDASWLDPEREAPAVPLASRDLAARLVEFLPALEQRRTRKKGWRFVFAVDLASESARVKAKSIREALASIGPIEVVDLRPAEAEIEGAERFHPLLVARSIEVGGLMAKSGEQRIHNALRAVLYGGQQKGEASLTAKDEQGEPDSGEEGADRFSLARHGLLVPPTGLPDEGAS